MPKTSGVNRADIAELAFVANDLRYEGSFVFLLPDALTDAVRRARDELALQDGFPAQPVPHMTLQFLGVCTGYELRRSHDHLATHVPQPPAVRFTGLSSFGQDGDVRNVHIAVEPSDQIDAARALVREHYLELPWARAALRDEWPFRPHVSVLDGVALREVPQLPADLVPVELVTLGRATILLRQIDGLR